MNKIYVKIEGIHCEHCEKKITVTLLKNKNIKKVKISNNIAEITYEKKLDKNRLIKDITSLDYITKEEYISENKNDLETKIKLKEFIIITSIIIIIAILLNLIFGFNIFNMIPTIDSNVTFGMLFVIGVLTSIHCISMCGAINIVASTNVNRSIKKPILYNLGRVISYTIIGGIIGFAGKVISINELVSGLIILITSIIMFLMSLKMLGLINFKLPTLNFKRVNSKNSFLIGLLNGFMPCGPLQAMQLYALSTRSFYLGALSMFLFSLGTVPLMLFLGIAMNIFKGRKKIIINKISSVLVLILSIVMINRGLTALNVNVFNNINTKNYKIATIYKNYQEVKINLDYDHYEDIIVQKNIPVKLIINVSKDKLTGCNNIIQINKYKIKKELKVGKNTIEFTPTKEETINYNCWMNMITNKIKVVDDKKLFKED